MTSVVPQHPFLAVPGSLVDSHCHLQLLEEDERERALDAARERGVRGFLVPAIRLEDADGLLTLCHRHEDVWCALGVHPHSASTWDGSSQERLRSLLTDSRAVAVGECGLDFFYDHAPRDDQFLAMRQQWELAIDLDLPVIVHNRDSNDEMLDQVRKPEHENLKADFHSFAGGLEMGRELIARGFFLGLSGMITFRRAENVREVIPEIPANRILIETDTPYLAPVPYRGKPNSPAYIPEIAERLASELNQELEVVAQRTSANFLDCFPKILES